jgi:hypothetical protein
MQTITVRNKTVNALLYIPHETANCRNPLIHNFAREEKT